MPFWNGELEKLTSYRFDIKMFIKRVRKADRYICGSQLARGLGARVKPHAESHENLEKIDEVDEAGNCTGWWQCFDHILTKLNLTTTQDVGLLAEIHLQKLRRAVGELPSDWIARLRVRRSSPSSCR